MGKQKKIIKAKDERVTLGILINALFHNSLKKEIYIEMPNLTEKTLSRLEDNPEEARSQSTIRDILEDLKPVFEKKVSNIQELKSFLSLIKATQTCWLRQGTLQQREWLMKLNS